MPRARSTSTAIAKRGTGTAMSAAEAKKQLAERAESLKNRIGAPASNKIKTKDKMFTMPDGTVTAGPIEAVIIDFVSRNLLFEGKYDPKNPSPPTCFAIGRVPNDDLVSSSNSPHRQTENCRECPLNEFGSDGDAKACKNTRYLAILPPGATSEDQIMTIEASPTAIRGYDGYVGSILSKFGVDPIGVVTSISFHPDQNKKQLIFEFSAPNEDIATYLARAADAKALLEAEPDATSRSEHAEKPTRARPRGRARR